ncbi:unnamed protein product [Cunninghamella echinulata]
MVTTRRSAAANKTALLLPVDNPEKITSVFIDNINDSNIKVAEEEKEKERNTSEEEDDSESEEDSESGEEDSEDEDGESESEDDSDDLNDLLEKAQLSLKAQQDNIMTLDDKKDPYKGKIFKLPKLNAGVDPEEELYIKDNATKAAKLVSDAVSIIEPGNESSSSPVTKNKSLITLKKVQEESKPLSRKERQLEREKTAGKGWFDMPRTEITPELKRDLEILKMRHILDRKRHYKKMGKNSDPKYFQVGTVIEGATEFFSARINKKDRKRTFVDEILSNDDQKDYYRNKYLTSQVAKSSGGKKHYKKLKAKRSL